MGLLGKVRAGVRQPERVVPYIRYNIQQERYRRRAKRMLDQSDLLHEFIGRERFVLILLDACRYDIFTQQADEYLEGDHANTHSIAGKTAFYLNRMWVREEMYDLTYVSANPQISDRAQRLRGLDYRPSEHIRTIVDVWADYWDLETGTVPPEPVTKVTLDQLREGREKLVVHYMQPHSPFIGGDTPLHARNLDASDPRIADAIEEKGHWRETAEPGKPLASHEENRIRPTDHLHELYDEGLIGRRDLRYAYRANLNRALEAVRDLVVRIDPSIPVVVSADHGEMLDDVPDRGFGHPDEFHRAVREVPWFRVDPAMQGTVDDPYDQEITRTETSDQSVEDRLSQLGYLQN